MSVQISTSTVFGIGLQSAFETLQTQDANFRYYAFTGLGYAPQQPVAQLPTEAGQSIMSRGQYKTGFWGAGPMNLVPRLDQNIGALLLALLGKDTYTADTGIAGTATGCSLHELSFNTAEEDLPYFTVRRRLPHTVVANRLGEIVADNRLGNAELSFPAVGPMTASLDISGRGVTFDNNPSWVGATYDNDDAFALMVDPSSKVIVEGAELAATNAVITINNNLIPADQMRVTGSYAPKDYPCTGRAASVRITAFLEDYELYSRIFTNGAFGDSMPWSSQVYKGDVDIRAFSPLKFGTAPDEFQYAIQFRNGVLGTENNVAWSLQNANIQPGQPIMLTLLGTLQRRSGGVPFQVRLQNNVTTEYALPA